MASQQAYNPSLAQGDQAPAPAFELPHLLPPPEKMIISGDLARNWEYFEDAWGNYATATEL